MTSLTIKAGGSIIASASFTDESGQAVLPLNVHWSLTDGSGNIINGRKDVSVTAANTVRVLLGPSDNPALADSKRVVIFKATYLSALIPGQQLEAIETGIYYVESVMEIGL
jgi:hypothetical protein